MITGFIFIAGNPVGGPMEYLTNLSLQIKMLIVLIAGINLLIFYVTGINRSLETVPPTATRRAAPRSSRPCRCSRGSW